MNIYHLIKNKKNIIILFMTYILSTSCLSRSTYNGARTTPQGELSLHGGITLAPLLPAIEVGARVGLAENIDIGADILLPGNIRGDVKFGLMNSENYAMSLGLGVSYWNFKTDVSLTKDSDGNEIPEAERKETSLKFSSIDVVVPIYNSFSIGKSFHIYVTPILGYAFTDSGLKDDEEASENTVDELRETFKNHDDDNFFFMGGNFGLAFGSKFQLVLEAGYFNHWPGLQLSLGLVLPTKSF